MNHLFGLAESNYTSNRSLATGRWRPALAEPGKSLVCKLDRDLIALCIRSDAMRPCRANSFSAFRLKTSSKTVNVSA